MKRTKVIDIELSQPLPNVEGLQGYAAVQGLVRLHGAPIGYVRLPLSNGRCTATAFSRAILEQHTQAIIQHLVDDGLAVSRPTGLRIADLTNVTHPSYNGELPSLTVAVCTRDRPDDLAQCLAALVQLDYPGIELLVIDNAPTSDASARLVQTQFPQIRYLHEPRPGLDWARNRAVAEAQGEIVAFTDDDVIVDPGWARAIGQIFGEHPDVMVVTGLVAPYELETQAQLLFEQYGGFGRGFERKWYCVDRKSGERAAEQYGWAGCFGTGANMAFRKSLFTQIGLFDPALDVGTPSNGGGDIELFFRALHAGYTLVYEPAALVRHRHRRDYASLRRQIANNGVGFSAYLVRSAMAHPDERAALFKFWLLWLGRWHLPRLARSLIGRESFPRDLIIAEAWGYFVGLGRYQQAQRKATDIARRFGVPAVQPKELALQ